MISAVADYLQTNSIGTVGTDIFIGELPFNDTDIISLIDVVSPPPNKSIPYFTQVIDVWARFTSYDTGYAKLKEVFDLLHRAEDYDITGFHIYLSYAMGMIDDLNRDTENRHIFKLSLAFIMRESSEIS